MSYSDDDLKKMENMFGVDAGQENDVYHPGITKIDDDYIYLEDIVCRDSFGCVREHYPKIAILRDHAKTPTTKDYQSTFDDTIEMFENHDFRMPSMALMCNILCTIDDAFQDKTGKFPDRLKLGEFMAEYAMAGKPHMVNTIVNYEDGWIKHYPKPNDINSMGKFNIGLRSIQEDFNPKMKRTLDYKNNLKEPEMYTFLQDYTGLEEPERMLRIAENFSTELKQNFYVSDNILPDRKGIGFIGGTQGGWMKIMTGEPPEYRTRGVKLW